MTVSTTSLLAIVLALGACVGGSSDDAKPLDLKQRIPAPNALRVSLPGNAGPEASASAEVFAAVSALNKRLAPLDLLQSYLNEGASRERDVSILVALETPPHVADQVVRYKRDESRLDVQRINDHVFYYLQVKGPKGYDPDQSITKARMLVDGGTLRGPSVGVRPSLAAVTGLASERRGFLRIHLNRRPDDRDDVNDAVQLDYEMARGVGEDAQEDRLHLLFYRQDKVQRADGQILAAWIRRDAEGGFVLQSEAKGSGATWSYLMQYKNDGSHAIWGADGTIRGCYSGSGAELGTAEDPTPCAVFDRPFVRPPPLKGVWPGLPSAVPK
ncbi:MAG: hypothetical protein CSA65_08730 [Proteobacteria bacterium]|nr:MAG: hypothetical protein CSB49_07120 [Pseudomonadota bacterium]PIE17498.1 MAG: hypothetical protein CSA65_08730 [Pseudomonadota bacterium]